MQDYDDPARTYLDGQLLVAMPGMEDERFARSVIYICAHSADGAMGLVINQPSPDVSFSQLLLQLDLIGEGDAIGAQDSDEIRVLNGGPVEGERGFVLHSSDFFIGNSTLPINQDICLTATLDILRAIARGAGPRQAVLALGYANWAPGQLDSELQHNGWLNCPADASLLFDAPIASRYDLAMQRLCIDPARLSRQAGHA